MKKLAMTLGVVLVVLLAMNAQAGQFLGFNGNLDPGIARPHSKAFGKSLNEWMETYVRWLAETEITDPPQVGRVRNVAFLPIIGGPLFEVEVKVGTALVLPVATWLAFSGEGPLPDEWFGDPAHIFGEVYLDGEPILEPNKDYYVGPTYFDPPLPAPSLGTDMEILLYQALVLIINPLPRGEHRIELHSEFVDFGAVYDNTWIVNVVPGKNSK